MPNTSSNNRWHLYTSPEIYIERKKIYQDLSGNQTLKLHNSGVMLYQLSFQALGEQGGGE